MSLPTVLREIAQKLIAGDWFKMISDDEKSFYYVIGRQSHDAELSHQAAFNNMMLPGGSARAPIGPIGEFKMRSQVAGSHPDYLKQARERLYQSGAPPDLIDRAIANLLGDDDNDAVWAELRPYKKSNPQLGWDYFMGYLKAYRVRLHESGSVPLQLDQDDELEVDADREKLCLQELVKKYGKIVDKWEQLDELPFEEPLLEEATKTYLYGFYRAAVMLSASALEHNLKGAIGAKSFDRYSDLVDDAAALIGLRGADITLAKEVFKIRNKVVHDNYEPKRAEAREALEKARSVLIEFLPPRTR